MSRINKTDSDLLAGLLHEAITKRLSGVGRAFYLLRAKYIVDTDCSAMAQLYNRAQRLSSYLFKSE